LHERAFQIVDWPVVIQHIKTTQLPVRTAQLQQFSPQEVQ
jgi:hypothetical protein